MAAEDILIISGVAVLGAVISLFLKDTQLPVLSVLAALGAGAVILIFLLPRLGQILATFSNLGQKANLSGFYLNTLLKVLGIAYIGEFAAQLCRDAEQGALALKIELGAKVSILFLALPIMLSVLDSVLKLLP